MSSTLQPHPLTIASESSIEQLPLLRHILRAPQGVEARIWESSIAATLQEFLLRPGKHFRAELVRLSWDLSFPPGMIPPMMPELLPWIVELLHAGSLIVDDIEDGSFQRRGKAALHRIVGLPIALNAGNWLYFRAISLIDELNLSVCCESLLYRRTLKAVQSCHEGQALDLSVQVGELHQREIPGLAYTISSKKTGSLLGLAGLLGSIAANAPESLQEALNHFGIRLGVGLQMQNDLCELMGAAGLLKQPEDLLHGRVTWPWAWASERLSPTVFDHLQNRGLRLTQGIGDASALANDLLSSLGSEPQRFVRNWLQQAFEELEAETKKTWGKSHPTLERIFAEITRLEKRYV